MYRGGHGSSFSGGAGAGGGAYHNTVSTAFVNCTAGSDDGGQGGDGGYHHVRWRKL